MIEEARHLPPSMVTVSIAFASLFTVLALGTILAVMADDTPQAPSIEELPILAESEIVDSIATCTDEACDGLGVLLMGRDLDSATLTGRLIRFWRAEGWESVSCQDSGTLCLADDDYRISVLPWDEVDPMLAPTLVEGVSDRDLDRSQLLYLHYYRCGAILPCG